MTEFATLKNPGFREEHKWRLVRLDEGSTSRKYRPGRYGVVPYIELMPQNGEKLPITRILAGPTADQSSTKRSIEMLLKDFGYAAVEVEVSTIPLR